MPNPAIEESLLRAAYDAYVKALAAGHRPIGKGNPAAGPVAARACGLKDSTFRNRLGQAIGLWGAPEWTEPAAPVADIDPVEARQKADELAEARKQVRDLSRLLAEERQISSVIQHLAGQDFKAPKWVSKPTRIGKPEPHVAVTMWSDWHAGEVVDLGATHGINEYNSEIMEARVERLVNKTVELSKHHGPGNYSGAVVMLGGDMVSGAIHAELAKTDDEEVIPACIRVVGLLVAGLTRMADAFGKVFVPAVPGNHGRNTLKPEMKRLVQNSFDWLIYQFTAQRLAGDKRIVFDIPQAGETLFRVYGTRYFLTHGDMLGTAGGDGIIGALGPITRGAFKVGRQQAALKQDFDVLCIGHWHQSIFLNHLIVSNTLKGFDEYAAKKLRALPSTPSQPLWFEHPRLGRVSSMEVWVEDKAPHEENAWASVPAGR